AEHYILQQDMEVFRKLYSIQNNENIYQSTFFTTPGSADKRYILIPPLLAKEILEMLVERKAFINTAQNEQQPFTVEKEDLPFQFLLEKNEKDDVMLKFDSEDEIKLLPEYEMIFANGVFHYLTQEQLKVIENLNQFNLKHLELAISKAQADQFFSEVIPSLKVVGDVQVAENIIEEVIQVPLQAKLYLESKNGMVTGRLEYHYGKHFIDPFNGRANADVIIMRDVEKEAEIMRLIEKANFHYNGKELYIETSEEEELY